MSFDTKKIKVLKGMYRVEGELRMKLLRWNQDRVPKFVSDNGLDWPRSSRPGVEMPEPGGGVQFILPRQCSNWISRAKTKGMGSKGTRILNLCGVITQMFKLIDCFCVLYKTDISELSEKWYQLVSCRWNWLIYLFTHYKF